MYHVFGSHGLDRGDSRSVCNHEGDDFSSLLKMLEKDLTENLTDLSPFQTR